MTTLNLGLFLLFLALLVFILASRTRRASGLPGGTVIYSDTSKWEKQETPLFDPISQITGRPDYLIRQGKEVIPVEVKSGRTPEAPYDAHIYQLAAYCRLVEREFGKRPSHGIIHYERHTFSVPYTQELEHALLDLLAEMRQLERSKNVPRSHEQSSRCQGCGYLGNCDQAL